MIELQTFYCLNSTKDDILAIKEDLEYIKEGLSTQEQILGSAIAGERFFKKHKKSIISIIVVAVLCVLVYSLNSFIASKNLKENNALYNALMLDLNNSTLANQLKKANPNLYALYAITMAKNGDMAPLSEAMSSATDDTLKEVLKAANGDNSILLADYDALLAGFKLLKDNKIAAAKLEFAKIAENSSLKQIAKKL